MEVKTGKRPVIAEGVENLGAHGIPNIKRAKTIKRKCFWILAFVGGLTLFTFHCYRSIDKYFDYGITVNLDIVFKPKIHFPAVSICNLNPVKDSALKNFTDLDDLLGPPPSSRDSSLLPVMPMSVTTQQSVTVGINTPSPTKRYQDWDNTDFGEMDSRHSLIDTTTDIIGAMDYEDRYETGHELDDMLLSCNFQGYPCSPSNFTWFYNYLYGNCYSFNLGLDIPVQEITTAGPLLGLTMSLYIQQDEYISDIQQGAGVRVQVHPQKSMAFPEDKGLNVAPGSEAFISVKKTYIERKGDPYTNCTKNGKKTIFMDQFPHVEYSKLMCEKDCYYNEVIRRCHCADVRYRYDNSTPACNSTNPENVRCLEQLDKANIPCPCTFACTEDIFNHVVSYSLWPNDKHKPIVQEGIKDISDNLRRSVENDTSFVEKNVVKLNVYYDELTYEYIYHTATYGEYDLLSDIGGNVGLWIGISVLTVVEIMELIFDVMMLCFIKAKSVGEKPTTDKKDTLDVDLVFPDSHVTGQKNQLPFYAAQNHSRHQHGLNHDFQPRRDSQIHPLNPASRSRRGSRKSKASSDASHQQPSRYSSTDELYYHNPDSFNSTKVVYNPAYTDIRNSSLY